MTQVRSGGRCEAQTLHSFKAECLKQLLQVSAQSKCAYLHAVMLILSNALAAWRGALLTRKMNSTLVVREVVRQPRSEAARGD
jgi:hypothetical protein